MTRLRSILHRQHAFALFAFSLLLGCAPAWAAGASVSVRVAVDTKKTGEHRSASFGSRKGFDDILVWLTPLHPRNSDELVKRRAEQVQKLYRLVQKDKQFSPHVLVLPVGASVEFPNQDPFFHNVFSLFNGRRFDLGLYEAGSHRTVRFDREGISYLFCNIHPEMGAVIVSLSTPFYTKAGRDGLAYLPDIPPGEYQLHVWQEQASPDDLLAAERPVHVASNDVHLPVIELTLSAKKLEDHKNKFGGSYRPDRDPSY